MFPKHSVVVFIYLLHDGQCPREEDCIAMSSLFVKEM